MPVDFGLLNQQMKSMMQGMQNGPFVFDPSQLTGDATTNRAMMYSGSAMTPRNAALTPGASPHQPAAPAGGLGALVRETSAPAAGPFQSASSAVASSAPTAIAMQPSQTQAQPSGGSPAGSYSGTGGPSLAGFDLSAIQQMFSPDRSPKEWGQVAIDPEWQKQYQAGHFGSVESALRDGGMKPTDGLFLNSMEAPPVANPKDGYWVMRGPSGQTNNEGGDSGGARALNQYQYIARPQEPQIPADLQAQVMQFLAGKGGGAT